MQDNYRNIYFNARQTAGLTQERWAEMLGISVEAVRQYECDRILPSDGVVARMAELSMLPPLGYWHLRHKSELAAAELPPVERLPLAQAVVQLLAAMRDFEEEHREDALLRIASDGRVDLAEEERFKAIVRDLHGIVQAALPAATARRGSREKHHSARSVSPAAVVSSTSTSGAAANAPSNQQPPAPSEMIGVRQNARSASVARRKASGESGTKPTSGAHSSAFGLITSGCAFTPSASADPLASSTVSAPAARAAATSVR